MEKSEMSKTAPSVVRRSHTYQFSLRHNVISPNNLEAAFFDTGVRFADNQ
jgi:hypothetical protein